MHEFSAGTFDIAVIGAGHAGIEAAHAAAMLGADVRTVVDIDENCLKTARENAEKNHVSIGRGLCGDALRSLLAFRSQKYFCLWHEAPESQNFYR